MMNDEDRKCEATVADGVPEEERATSYYENKMKEIISGADKGFEVDDFISLVKELINDVNNIMGDDAEKTATALLSCSSVTFGVVFFLNTKFTRDAVEEAIFKALGKCERWLTYDFDCNFDEMLRILPVAIPSAKWVVVNYDHRLDESNIDELAQVLHGSTGSVGLSLTFLYYRDEVVNSIARLVEETPEVDLLELKPRYYWDCPTMTQDALQTLCQTLGASSSIRRLKFGFYPLADDDSVDECANMLANAMLDSTGQCFDCLGLRKEQDSTNYKPSGLLMDKVSHLVQSTNRVRNFEPCFRKKLVRGCTPWSEELELTRSNRWKSLCCDDDGGNIPLACWPYILAKANLWNKTKHSFFEKEETGHSSLDPLYFLFRAKSDVLL